jgi:clan AA aspartic protease (TIGR02281 family)
MMRRMRRAGSVSPGTGEHRLRYGLGLSGLVLALGLFAGEQPATSAQPDPVITYQRYRLAAAQGDPAALVGLGTLFEQGAGVPRDFAKAYTLFHLAASRQSADPALVARAAGHRDAVGARMSPAQLARVNELIALCNGSDVNRCGEIIIAAGAPAGGSPSTLATRDGLRVPRDGKTIVQMEPLNGIYVVPVVINGVMTVKFAIDTGATDVAIPADVVATLVKAGFIEQSDFLGERTYRIADGSTMPSQTFRIRSLQVGNVVIENVLAHVLPENAPLLLGQSFLRRLKSWSMDNATHVLIIE